MLQLSILQVVGAHSIRKHLMLCRCGLFFLFTSSNQSGFHSLSRERYMCVEHLSAISQHSFIALLMLVLLHPSANRQLLNVPLTYPLQQTSTAYTRVTHPFSSALHLNSSYLVNFASCADSAFSSHGQVSSTRMIFFDVWLIMSMSGRWFVLATRAGNTSTELPVQLGL